MNIENFELKPILIAKDNLAPDWSWNSSNNHWTGFHLWYIIKNEVKIETNGMQYHLLEGDTFLFDLSKNHHCTHDPQHPASMYTVYFHCQKTEKLQQMLTKGQILRQNHPLLYNTNVHLFDQALGAATEESTEVWLAPIFQQLLTPGKQPEEHLQAEKIRRLLDAAPQHTYSLDELAAQAGYSKNQFIRIFRTATGYTPYAYQLRARIQRAQNLLLFSDYNVTEIAKVLGYNDLNHFSSQFFQKVGCYPSQYAAAAERDHSGKMKQLKRPEMTDEEEKSF